MNLGALCMLGAVIVGAITAVCVVKEFWHIRRADNCDWRELRIVVSSVFFVALLCYGKLVTSMHFSVDSYNLLFDMSPYYQMQIGRFLSGGIILCAIHAGINQVVSQQFFMFIWIITLTLETIMIGETLGTYIAGIRGIKKGLLYAAIGCTFFNVFMMDLMLFTEMAMVLFLSNLTLALAIRYAIVAGERKGLWLLSLAFLSVSLSSYQAYITVFEVFVLLGIFVRYEDDLKRRYVFAVLSLFLGALAAIGNIAFTKILIRKGLLADSGRGASFDIKTIHNNILTLMEYQKHFWTDADGIFPLAIMIIVGMVLFAMFIHVVFRLETMEKRVFVTLFITGAYTLAFMAHVIEGHIVLSPRSNIGVWSVISLILLLFIIYGNYAPARLRQFAVALAFMLYLPNIVVMGDMIESEAQINAVDQNEAIQFCAAIKEYEAESGNHITKLAMKGDANNEFFLPVSRYRDWELGKRIMSTYYSNYRLLSHYLERSCEKVDMPEDIYQEHFFERDWNCMNVTEQLYCDGDTAYIMVY